MGAPEPDQRSDAGDAPEQGRSERPANAAAVDLAASLGVDYNWLQQQLAQLGTQLGGVGIEDEFEEDVS